MNRGKIPLAAMHLRSVWDLAIAWRRRRMFYSLMRRLYRRHIALAWSPVSTPPYQHVRSRRPTLGARPVRRPRWNRVDLELSAVSSVS